MRRWWRVRRPRQLQLHRGDNRLLQWIRRDCRQHVGNDGKHRGHGFDRDGKPRCCRVAFRGRERRVAHDVRVACHRRQFVIQRRHYSRYA